MFSFFSFKSIKSILLATGFIATLSSPLMAQDRQGNDTPGDWKVTHHASFGLWDSLCDERPIVKGGTQLTKRCYIRYVETYSLRPNFGAAFAFITRENGAHRFEYGMERGLTMGKDALRVEQNKETIWSIDPNLCGSPCILTDEKAKTLLDFFHTDEAASLVFEFTAKDNKNWKLQWDLNPFAQAFADFTEQAQARGL